MPSERFELVSDVRQRLDRADRQPCATALFAHRFPCGKGVLAASRIAAAPVEHGVACLRFDLIGLVLHLPADDTLGDSARPIFDAAKHSNSSIALDGTDHLLPRPADPRYAAALIAA